MVVAFQDAFVALATDAGLRRRFATDPDGALAGFALDATAHAALRGLSREALERYAQALVAKRWHEVARVVPLALRVAPSIGARYRAWALSHPAPVTDTILSPGVAEAERALAAVHDQLARDEREAAYAAPLWAFEVLRAAARGDRRPRGFAAPFALHEIVADIERGLLPIDPAPVRVRYRFERDRVMTRSA